MSGAALLRRGLVTAALAAVASAVRAAGPAVPPPEWRTVAEASGFRATGNHGETLAFLRRLEGRLPEMRVTSFGTSAEGRELPLVVVSRDRVFDPEGARRGPRPVVLFLCGIHAGEIDGKDAALMILRDLALGGRRELLDAATLLVAPVYNADGHERVSPWNRPNQDGPAGGMGFRTTASGLDLNRDFLKAASPEARALLRLFGEWRPHLVVDNHVTDGSRHGWVLTWAVAEAPQAAPPLAAWQRARLPAVFAAVAAAGHPNGPYVDLLDEKDPRRGFETRAGEPRFSTGYFALRNRVAILVENNSYAPFRERVLANRDFLAALLAEVGRDPGGLRRAVEEAEAATVAAGRPGAPPSDVALRYERAPDSEPRAVPFHEWSVEPSRVRGEPLLAWRETVRELTVPWFHQVRAARTVPRPRGYFVLPGWPVIEERLRAHGLRVLVLGEALSTRVESARLSKPRLAARPYQGLVRVEEVAVTRQVETRSLPAGTLFVPADQPDFEVAVQLLEPEAPDSLVSWGLLSSVFEQKEYIEKGVLEAWAADALQDPAVVAAWEAALKDESLAGDPAARHQWWYTRTPYWDRSVGLLPVFRASAPPEVATRPF